MAEGGMLPDLTVGDVYLQALMDRGVEVMFANAGTDFAPLIEGMSKAHAHGQQTIRPVTVPHENAAVAMAMGYYLVSGKPQVVMVHVSVGTANTICGLFNASRGDVPMLLTAGRTPLTESGMKGGRTVDIHWPQEMYDQAGMLRELVKWDYELRHDLQVEDVIDRALSIAQSEPMGPVYLSLPREVVASPASQTNRKAAGRINPATRSAPDPSAIDQAAEWLASAKKPVIITTSAGRNVDAVAALGGLAEEFAIPVVQYRARYNSIPYSHPMHLGFEPGSFLKHADAILVVDSAVPWLPAIHEVAEGAKIVQMAPDPQFGKLPIRGFPADLAISTSTVAGLNALHKAIDARGVDAEIVAKRRDKLADERAAIRENWAATIEAGKTQSPISPHWISHCIGEAKPDDAIVIKESPLLASFCPFEQPGTFISAGASGGLGWGLGCAVGAKLAAGDDRLVICTQGDGAYMFGTPIAAHYTAKEQDAPILTVIYNNQRWEAVHRATTRMYPDGYASKSNAEPLTYFTEINLEKAVEVVGGYGEMVTDPAEVPAALQRGIDAVTKERRQAVINIVCTTDPSGP